MLWCCLLNNWNDFHANDSMLIFLPEIILNLPLPSNGSDVAFHRRKLVLLWFSSSSIDHIQLPKSPNCYHAAFLTSQHGSLSLFWPSKWFLRDLFFPSKLLPSSYSICRIGSRVAFQVFFIAVRYYIALFCVNCCLFDIDILKILYHTIFIIVLY